MKQAPTLILPPRYTPDTIAIGQAAGRAGWAVERLPSWRVRPDLSDLDLVLYGEPLFAEIIACQLGVTLLEPACDWLPALPQHYRRRAVRLTTLGRLKQPGAFAGPAFVKPAGDKCFTAKVYESPDALRAETADDSTLAPSTPTLISDPVSWEIEFRYFVLDRRALTTSPYLRGGELALDADGGWWAEPVDEVAADAFMAGLLADPAVRLPPGVVVDVGRITGRGWAVVEANPAWGSGIYGCDPHQVLRAVRRGCIKSGTVVAEDAPWAHDEGLSSQAEQLEGLP